MLEQNFQFDLVSTQKLLLKFIDREITVDKTAGNTVTPITGTLLSAIDGIVLRGKDGSIYSLPAYTSVRFPDLPGGLNTRPTLVWDVHSPAGGTQKTRVTYQTGGITWWADYNLIFNEGADAEQRAARSVRLGEHHQPVRRHLSGRETQAHRRRRESRAARDG